MDDVRLPEDIERGAVGGPGFKTTVITLDNGNEQRNSDWAVSRGQWDIGYGIRRRADLQAVIDFFYGRRGKARGFRFKDWLDFSATAEDMGAVTGDVTKRQLQKVYSADLNPYTRIITLPVVGSITIYIDNFAADPGDWSLGANGVITFTGGDPGSNVKATFEFDVPVRFDTDNLPVTLNTYNEGDITNIPILELRS
jgi:uncharacterized protein (TIGR02217 family)